MDHVLAVQQQPDRAPHRDPELVGRGDELTGSVGILIGELPPPLVAGNRDVQNILRRSRRLLQLEEGEHRPDTQAQDQYGRDDGPGNFQWSVAVGLDRQSLPGTAAETDQGIQKRPLHQDEDHHHGPQKDVKEK